jgi:hypothetical protein
LYLFCVLHNMATQAQLIIQFWPIGASRVTDQSCLVQTPDRIKPLEMGLFPLKRLLFRVWNRCWNTHSSSSYTVKNSNRFCANLHQFREDIITNNSLKLTDKYTDSEFVRLTLYFTRDKSWRNNMANF